VTLQLPHVTSSLREMKISAGILALLSLASLHGRAVERQHTAIRYLQAWFSQWRQETEEGMWWPQWLTRDHLRTGNTGQHEPGRASWCYGSPGIARALQLAALATGDHYLQREAESALATGLTGRQLDRITSAGLCHGIAGLYQVASRAVADALSPAISQQLPALATKLTKGDADPRQPGFLTGQAGHGLALETARQGAPPRSGWDACLLIT
jgi:hypothetical protein